MYSMFKEFRHRRTNCLEHRGERRARIQSRYRINLQEIHGRWRDDEVGAREVRHTERAMRSAGGIGKRQLLRIRKRAWYRMAWQTAFGRFQPQKHSLPLHVR